MVLDGVGVSGPVGPRDLYIRCRRSTVAVSAPRALRQQVLRRPRAARLRLHGRVDLQSYGNGGGQRRRTRPDLLGTVRVVDL